MTAVVAVRPPWYRRLFGRQRAMAAGERPGRMGQRSRGSGLGRRLFLLLLALALVGAVASYLVVPQVRDRVDSLVADARRMYDTLRNPGQQALDERVGTYWLADPTGGPPVLSVNFTDTVNLVEATFHLGAGPEDDFTRYRRPKTVEFRFPGGSPVQLVLDDGPEAQKHPINIPGVRTLEMRVLDFYDAGAGDEVLAALREVEFRSGR